MPRKKSNHKKPKTPAKAKSAGRPIWKGTINFGLVNIPVALYSAETDGSIDFDLLDKRDFSRIRYRRVNEKTGREVPWDHIVKGYQYKRASMSLSRTPILPTPTSKLPKPYRSRILSKPTM